MHCTKETEELTAEKHVNKQKLDLDMFLPTAVSKVRNELSGLVFFVLSLTGSIESRGYC